MQEKNLVITLPFKEWMERNNIQIADIAEKLEITKQTVYYWFSEDDIRLSALINSAAAFNATLLITMSYQGKGYQETKTISVTGDADSSEISTRIRNNMNMSIKDMCEILGMTNVNHAQIFKRGVVRMSTLLKMAEVSGVKLSYSLDDIG